MMTPWPLLLLLASTWAAPPPGETLQALLQPSLHAAQCEARCPPQTSERDACLATCSLLLAGEDSDLCSRPLLCSGGCRTACVPGPRPSGLARLLPAPAPSCSVAWSLLPAPASPTLYMVVGRDEGGMWRLLTPSPLPTTSLSTRGLTHLSTLRIFAVDSSGLVDKVSLYPEHGTCGEEQLLPRASGYSARWSRTLDIQDILYVILPGSLIMLLLALLLLACCRKSCPQQDSVPGYSLEKTGVSLTLSPWSLERKELKERKEQTGDYEEVGSQGSQGIQGIQGIQGSQGT